jgi:hypothetical protein
VAKVGRRKRIRIPNIGSNEWQEWHLMPDEGWVEGRQKLDCMPRQWNVPTPRGRVFTCRVGDKLDALWDKPAFYIEERWRTRRPGLLAGAVGRHGKWPPDFRTETLKKLQPTWLKTLRQRKKQ